MKLSSVFCLVAICALGLAASAQACTYSGAERVFSPWGDSHSYVLAGDGGFEAGAKGWTLRGGAARVALIVTLILNGAGF